MSFSSTANNFFKVRFIEYDDVILRHWSKMFRVMVTITFAVNALPITTNPN